MGAIVIWTKLDEGMESAEVATSVSVSVSTKWSFFPNGPNNTIIQWNMLPQTVIASTSADCFREQLTPSTLLNHTVMTKCK